LQCSAVPTANWNGNPKKTLFAVPENIYWWIGKESLSLDPDEKVDYEFDGKEDGEIKKS